MKKEELYDPVKTGSFRMMFGFQTTKYIPTSKVGIN